MNRFGFGKNWLDYSRTVDEEKILAAEESLQTMLGIQSLAGCSFLDAGSGSGLFSLAAHRLGASPVISFDYDPDSVTCTQRIREKYGHDSREWKVMQGDVLDASWLAELGQFDIVYSWGVLHHTGNMWQAIDNVCTTVKPDGYLFISIYNDQGWISRVWHSIKRAYNHGGQITKLSLLGLYMVYFLCANTARGIVRCKNPRDWHRPSGRGMTIWHDAVDWVGGYPYETATPEQLESFLLERGFIVTRSQIKTGSGCNEFALKRTE